MSLVGRGKSECDNCAAGKSSDKGKKMCSDCEAGTFSNLDTKFLCQKCSENTWSGKGASSCYALATADQMASCPESKGADKGIHNVCNWYFSNELTPDSSLKSENEGDLSPFVNVEKNFADSCANYTICKVEPVFIKKDEYSIMCNACADGYSSTGTVTGVSGVCLGNEYENYCYDKEEFNKCPPETRHGLKTECEYQYNGQVDVDDGGDSPFMVAIPETTDKYASCAEYKVCSVGKGLVGTKTTKLQIACSRCADGFMEINMNPEVVGDCAEGMHPTGCFSLKGKFLECPVDKLNSRVSRFLGEDVAIDNEDENEGEDFESVWSLATTARNLGSSSCKVCSCSLEGSSIGRRDCDPEDMCVDDGDIDDCDNSLCECTGGTTSGVKCHYMYTGEVDTKTWVEVGGGGVSPFGETCAGYLMCSLEVGGTIRSDKYYVACGQCAVGHYPSMGSNFDQTRKPNSKVDYTCGEESHPTYCYPLSLDNMKHHDYKHCPTNVSALPYVSPRTYP